MTNRLKHETSPYLLQHAGNPVDWQPWDDEALALAREQDKPILLSIGYSACHWCHVMAHESFEDRATADVMNDLYVNIKVDREERPDIDRIYQLAQQMFTGRPGGWPLTMFLTPDAHLPIFAGTYFPKTANYGMPAFVDVLTRVESYYRTHADEVATNGERILERFGQIEKPAAATADPLTTEPLHEARLRLGEHFDAAHGGFGGAPKFPHPTYIDLLLMLWRTSARKGNEDTGAGTIVRGSLDAMAAGGLCDHLGGGFFRYCVDGEWRIPHFEKMLYDNAALLATYADAFAATGESDYARIAGETADWVRRRMRSPEGGFYATLDADSADGEGSYYVFTPDDFDAHLGADAGFAKSLFGLDGPPNFDGRAWHLQTRTRDAYRDLDDAGEARLARVRASLLDARTSRAPPGRDDKILASWNGLMIAGLAKSARRLSRPDLTADAHAAAAFVRERMWRDGRLLAVYKDGRSRFMAYLDDYAFMLGGLVELLQTDFRPEELGFAQMLADTVLAHYADPAGGCFFTADDHEKLIHRSKPLADEAVPSGNATLAIALTALGHLLGEPRYLDAAEASVRAAWPALRSYPEAHATYLQALALALEPPQLVIVRGAADTLGEWRREFDREYVPGRFSFFIDAVGSSLPGALAHYPDTSGTVGYVCTGATCSAPAQSPDELLAAASF